MSRKTGLFIKSLPRAGDNDGGELMSKDPSGDYRSLQNVHRPDYRSAFCRLFYLRFLGVVLGAGEFGDNRTEDKEAS